ncbi:4-phosphoerythronate dehydrogenase [Dongshaea marina]|uniref:4-phosphoerythronate dehydrogenase n=1 Tax=Dongshaea marina TaxID=2047966 RepID=UPI000D3E5EE6|nr:4-phosphoerythronate dehydrogenase [Dongshaea marina]
MHFVIDENIPYAEQFFAHMGSIERVNGRELAARQLKNADILLVRSVTQVNQELLAEAEHLRFVGTATIGTDHVDQDYLKQRGIRFSSAPGCNRISVAEYVLSALLVVAERQQLDLRDLSLGIVGVGNIGRELSSKATALGMKLLLCDPPRARAGDTGPFISHQQLLWDADIISYHVPLTPAETQDGTFHLLGASELNSLTGKKILVNSSRGEVWDNRALLARQMGGEPLNLVMDVWESEPDILQDLIPHTQLATPHIAGYSLEGKARGTEILYRAVCDCLGMPTELSLQPLLPEPEISTVRVRGVLGPEQQQKLMQLVYDVRQDDARFRAQVANPGGFDRLRKTYPVRRELSSLRLEGVENDRRAQLQELGFYL